MPIYEYRCAACGFQKEYLQKMSDAPLTECPECGKPTLAKMVTAAGFQLKGSGWYATDFKTAAKSKTKTEGTDTAPAQSEDKSKAKTDDKPAAPVETKSTPETAATKSDAAKTATTSGAGSGST